MTGGPWFATGPTLETAPSAATMDAEQVLLRASARARFYGVGLVWAVVGGRAVEVRRVERDAAPVRA